MVSVSRRLREVWNRFRLSPLQPPRQLESLDDLLAQSAHYANLCRRNSGTLAPTLFLIGADGPLMFVPAWLAEAFDRQEVIVLVGEAYGRQKQLFLPIIRSGNGKFFGLGESELPSLDKLEGRFAGMLPPTMPPAEHRALAKARLMVKGVNLTKPGTTVRLTPPRR